MCYSVIVCSTRRDGNFKIFNSYHPCRRLTGDIFRETGGEVCRREMWCGDTKKRTWREFCATIRRETKVQDIWSIFKKMSGKRKYIKIYKHLVVDRTVSDREKADMLGKAFAAVQSGEHLRKKENLRERKEDASSSIDMGITMKELKSALKGTGYTAPGEDKLCYAMF